MKTRRQVGKGVRAWLNLSRSDNSKWCYLKSLDPELKTYIKNIVSNASQFKAEFSHVADKFINSVELNGDYLLKYLNALTRQIRNSSFFRSSFNSCLNKQHVVKKSNQMDHTIKQLLLSEACDLYNSQKKIAEKDTIKVEINNKDDIKFYKPCSNLDTSQWYLDFITIIKDAAKTIVVHNEFKDFDDFLNEFLYDRLLHPKFHPPTEFNDKLNWSLIQLKQKLMNLVNYCGIGKSLDRDLKNEILLSYCKSYNARNVKFNGVNIRLFLNEKDEYVVAVFNRSKHV
jgi:hypothetical protein